MLTIRLKLDQHELEALQRAAALELRHPPEQARYIIRQELIRLGLLDPALFAPLASAPEDAPDQHP